MGAIFLSASVPVPGRGDYYESASPFLIQCAVRELVIAVIRKRRIVWGGHPAITPMIWSICEDLSIDYSSSVVLYQSRYFQDSFPDENARFSNVIFTDSVEGDRNASLELMREKMLSRDDLDAAVFIGGMEGVALEHRLFLQFHPTAKVLTVPAPGGAALELARSTGCRSEDELCDVDFAQLFYSKLG